MYVTSIAVGGGDGNSAAKEEITGKGVKFREADAAAEADVDAVDGAVASRAARRTWSLPRPPVEISESRWEIQKTPGRF